MRIQMKRERYFYNKDSLDGGLSFREVGILAVLAVATGILLGFIMKEPLAAVLWILLMGALIGLEALPVEERVQAEHDQAENEVERRVLTLVNAFYCVAAASLVGLICLVVYNVFL